MQEESSDEAATNIIRRPGQLSVGQNSKGHLVASVAGVHQRLHMFFEMPLLFNENEKGKKNGSQPWFW